MVPPQWIVPPLLVWLGVMEREVLGRIMTSAVAVTEGAGALL